MKIRFLFLLTLLLCSVSLAQPPRGPHPRPKIEAAPGGLPDKAVQEAIFASLDAIEADDFANFAHLGNDSFKAGLTKAWFDEMVKLRAPRLEKGYNVVYLGDLKREAYTVHLWKLVFADKVEELLGEMSWQDGKIHGYWIH